LFFSWLPNSDSLSNVVDAMPNLGYYQQRVRVSGTHIDREIASTGHIATVRRYLFITFVCAFDQV
jgi:hypothetical protein